MAKTAKTQTTSKAAAKTATTNTAKTATTNTAAATTTTPTAAPATDVKKSEQVQTFTSAESSYADKSGSYNVKVSKTTSNPNSSIPYYRTTINEEVKTATTEFSRTDIQSNTLATTGSVREASQVYETTNTYDKKGRMRNQEVHDVEQTSHTNSSLSEAKGYHGTAVNFNEKTTKTEYDKKDRITSKETHEVTSGPSVSQRMDTKDTYKKGELRRELKADNALAGISLSDRKFKKGKEGDKFVAQKSNNGESYFQQKGNKQYSVEVDSSGNVTGTKNKLNSTKVKEMSPKQAKSALQDMRAKFDAKLQELSGAQTPEEYTKAIPSPLSIGRTEPVSQIFTQATSQERASAEQIKSETRGEFKNQQITNNELTADQIAQMRLAQLRKNQNN